VQSERGEGSKRKRKTLNLFKILKGNIVRGGRGRTSRGSLEPRKERHGPILEHQLRKVFQTSGQT